MYICNENKSRDARDSTSSLCSDFIEHARCYSSHLDTKRNESRAIHRGTERERGAGGEGERKREDRVAGMRAYLHTTIIVSHVSFRLIGVADKTRRCDRSNDAFGQRINNARNKHAEWRYNVRAGTSNRERRRNVCPRGPCVT